MFLYNTRKCFFMVTKTYILLNKLCYNTYETQNTTQHLPNQNYTKRSLYQNLWKTLFKSYKTTIKKKRFSP